MQRLMAVIEYDGTNFSGMQRQQNHKTIQGEIEKVLSIVLKQPSEIDFSGRTDAGVHALGQVISFDVAESYFAKYQNVKSSKIITNIKPEVKTLSPINIINKAENSILNSLNFFLASSGIVCVDIKKVENDFNPRRWAIKRTYIYKICNRKAPLVIDFNRKWHVPFILDVQKMRRASEYFLGKHDFTSFRSKECTSPNPIRSIESIIITQNGSDIEITITAKSFLHKMVRNIVGTLVSIGKTPSIKPDIVKDIILAKNRSEAFVTAPPHGLYFYRVFY